MSENQPQTAQIMFTGRLADDGTAVVEASFGQQTGLFPTRTARGLAVGLLQVAERAETEALFVSWLAARWGSKMTPDQIAGLLNDFREFAIGQRRALQQAQQAAQEPAQPAPAPEPGGEIVRLFGSPEEVAVAPAIADRLDRLEAELNGLRKTSVLPAPWGSGPGVS